LTAIEEGNPTFVGDNENMINWDKMIMISKVKKSIANLQINSNYGLKTVPFMEEYLLEFATVVVDDAELRSLSFKILPN